MAQRIYEGAYTAQQAQEGAYTAHPAQGSIPMAQQQQQNPNEEYARQNEWARQAQAAQQAQWQNAAAPMTQQSANYAGAIQNTFVAAQQATCTSTASNNRRAKAYTSYTLLRLLDSSA